MPELFYLFVAAMGAFLGYVLGSKGASRKRPIIARGFSWLGYAVAAVFGWWAMVALLG
ncbi:hypothetical protein [Erythrobacter litoralis]|uniref:Uncharacterized protein n=1 Tax=Erythrobacter litoralis (strain HTCC2594) TaxID=314225 RepID=Q2N7C5_ERYLH|nr:hypothetical protein [Erythrobacter litoralis]ABC64416.1 hypothetical protein ELI_11620 [Erythrobacter litoralis HTCC2594]